MELLNVGCGRHFHPAWRNLDVVSLDPSVEACDLRRGIPSPAARFDMVYHSHVLEHLSPNEGRAFLAECVRVLKPGGLLRVVVPDLEQIARLYLASLDQAWNEMSIRTAVSREQSTGDEEASAEDKYRWMKLELLDQLARQRSGGEMGPAMLRATGGLASFIRQRLGREMIYAADDPVGALAGVSIEICGSPNPTPNRTPNSPPVAARRRGRRSWRERWARRTLRWLLGAQACEWLEVGRFRASGEVHRWMYDRYSLLQLSRELGLIEFRICTATESGLERFADYELDAAAGRTRKPDSLFVECRKPIG